MARMPGEMNLKKMIDMAFEKGYIDDHEHHLVSRDNIHFPDAVLIHTRLGAVPEIIPANTKSQYFSINHLYYNEDDKMLHLTTISSGGVVDNRGGDFEKAIENYNKEMGYNGKHNTIISQLAICWPKNKLMEAAK